MRTLVFAIALCGIVTTAFGIHPSPTVIQAALDHQKRSAEATPPPQLAAPTTPSGPALPALPANPDAAPEVDSTVDTPTARDTRPLIQFAICLDTSGSMEGLINSARQKLWAITNELALAEPTPRLEVALLTYGNDGHNPERGWVATHLDFTEDLDAVSALLFSFVTNGGTELVGRVLQAADRELAWDDAANTLRICFVAGNETADQDGQVPYRDAAARLIARDISVSSIYCGNPEDAIAPGWREIALRGDGHFATIDQNHGTLVIPTPYDDDLTKLSAALNATYIPYGSGGQVGWANQQAQDRNNEMLNCDAAAGRAACKASSNYFCSWDLVDMVREKQIEVTKIVISDLPEKLQSLTIEKVVEHVNTCQTERDAIQAKIQDLSKKRAAFLEAEMAKQELTEENAFDTAVRNALREKARLKGFRFPEDAPVERVPAPAPVTVDAAPVGTPQQAGSIQIRIPAAASPQVVNPRTGTNDVVELLDTGC